MSSPRPLAFAVVGYPRSGTTWVANWLTTESMLCLHEPLLSRTVAELRELRFERRWGVSCTALLFLPEELSSLAERVVLIRRPLAACNASLRRMGLTPPLPDDARLEDLCARHHAGGGPRVLDVPFEGLFRPETAERVFRHVCPTGTFDALRHAELCRYRVDPVLDAYVPRPEAVKSWAELAARAALRIS